MKYQQATTTSFKVGDIAYLKISDTKFTEVIIEEIGYGKERGFHHDYRVTNIDPEVKGGGGVHANCLYIRSLDEDIKDLESI